MVFAITLGGFRITFCGFGITLCGFGIALCGVVIKLRYVVLELNYVKWLPNMVFRVLPFWIWFFTISSSAVPGFTTCLKNQKSKDRTVVAKCYRL